MRVTLKLPEDDRKRQDKSVWRAKKRGRRARVLRAQALLPDHVRRSARKTLIRWADQSILASNGRPLGECRIKSALTIEHVMSQKWQRNLVTPAFLSDAGVVDLERHATQSALKGEMSWASWTANAFW